MNTNEPDRERLRRLRDRQLADRDPGATRKEFQRRSLERDRRSFRPLTWKDTLAGFSPTGKAVFLAIVLGLMSTLLITSLWKSPWAWGGSIILDLFILVASLSIGQAIDSRNKMKDH